MGGDKKTIKELSELYTKILSCFRPINVNFILFYGTLLGCHRDSQFINEDDDIDVLVSIEDFNKIINYLPKVKILNRFIKSGYISYRNDGFPIENFIQIFYKNLGPFDICAYTLEKDHILTAFDNLLYPKIDIFPLKQIEFNGQLVSIPNNTDEILKLTYGENWKIPQIKGVDYHPYKIVDNIKKT